MNVLNNKLNLTMRSKCQHDIKCKNNSLNFLELKV